jgi:hypothetical protein
VHRRTYHLRFECSNDQESWRRKGDRLGNPCNSISGQKQYIIEWNEERMGDLYRRFAGNGNLMMVWITCVNRTREMDNFAIKIKDGIFFPK